MSAVHIRRDGAPAADRVTTVLGMEALAGSEQTLLSAEDEERLARTIEAGVLARAAREGAIQAAATDEELALIQQAGERAWQRFVRANLGLVALVTGREAHRCAMPQAELFQEGCLGLMTAVQKFDHRRGCRFSTYALSWIRAAVSAASSRRCGEVNLPVWRAEALRRARGVETELTVQLGRPPTADEVAKVLRRDATWVADLLAHQRPSSLESLCEEGLQVEDPGLAAALDHVSAVTERDVVRLLDQIPRLEQQVLRWRFGFMDESRHSRADIARRLGIGTTRCRALEMEGLDRLRRLLEEEPASSRTAVAAA